MTESHPQWPTRHGSTTDTTTDTHGHPTDTHHVHTTDTFTKAQVRPRTPPRTPRTPTTDTTPSPFRGRGGVVQTGRPGHR